jgi:hypothetical protein
MTPQQRDNERGRGWLAADRGEPWQDHETDLWKHGWRLRRIGAAPAASYPEEPATGPRAKAAPALTLIVGGMTIAGVLQ